MILIAFDMSACIPCWIAFTAPQRLKTGPVLPEQVTHTYLNISNNLFPHSGFDPFVWETKLPILSW